MFIEIVDSLLKSVSQITRKLSGYIIVFQLNTVLYDC